MEDLTQETLLTFFRSTSSPLMICPWNECAVFLYSLFTPFSFNWNQFGVGRVGGVVKRKDSLPSVGLTASRTDFGSSLCVRKSDVFHLMLTGLLLYLY